MGKWGSEIGKGRQPIKGGQLEMNAAGDSGNRSGTCAQEFSHRRARGLEYLFNTQLM